MYAAKDPRLRVTGASSVAAICAVAAVRTAGWMVGGPAAFSQAVTMRRTARRGIGVLRPVDDIGASVWRVSWIMPSAGQADVKSAAGAARSGRIHRDPNDVLPSTVE